MNIKECYNAFYGDYNDVIGRLLTDQRVEKFLKLFLLDDSFANLCDAMQNGDYETAFRAAHTLKGTCLNLGMSRLASSASEITEALRGNVNNGADLILPKLVDDYMLTVNAIKELNQ